MAEIINLRRARKQKARADKEARAAQNLTVFGRTGAEKERTKAERDKAERVLAAHRLEPPRPDDETP